MTLAARLGISVRISSITNPDFAVPARVRRGTDDGLPVVRKNGRGE